jgi:protein SCO1/2
MPYPEPVETAEDFTLTDQEGRPFRLADHRGRVVLLFFGFVHCPDVCPVTLSTWGKVQAALDDARDRVEFVFVTVDPERDTPESLRRHLEIYGQEFHGLTGSQEQLAGVYEAYGIFQEKVPVGSSAGGYVVDHSTRMLLIDATGRLRLRYAFDVAAEDIVHDVRRLLAERAGP